LPVIKLIFEKFVQMSTSS